MEKIPGGMMRRMPDPRFPFMAPPLASTKKLTRKPNLVGGWAFLAGEGPGQLEVDGLCGVKTSCLDGKEAEFRTVVFRSSMTVTLLKSESWSLSLNGLVLEVVT